MDSRETLLSRRRLLSQGAAAGMISMLGLPSTASAAAPPDPESNVLNVRSFGAAGNAATDDTAAFQRALDAASHAGGGSVYAPPGRYLFRGTINIPDGVTLRGSYACVPSHVGLRNPGAAKPGDDGTALFVTAGKGRRRCAVSHAQYEQLRRRTHNLLPRAGHQLRPRPLSMDGEHARQESRHLRC